MKKSILLLFVIAVSFIYYLFRQPSFQKDIKLGSSLPLSGINKKLGIAFKEGAMAYFEYANSNHLLRGKKVELITYDDKYEPELTRENLHRLLTKDKVFALFGFVGTPTIKAIMPIISDSDIPFIAPFSGASFLREPKRDNFVNFRSSYANEIDKIVKYLYYKKNIKRFAIFYQNDDYGYDGYIGTIKSLKKRGLSLVAEGTYRRNTLSVSQALLDIKALKPEAIIMVGAYKPVALFVKRYRKMSKKKDTLFCNISFVNADELVKELNYKTKNMLFSQTVPSYDNLKLPIIREYRKVLKATYKESRYGFVSLEAYLDAKITVEALKDIKGTVSRDNFLTNLRTLSKLYKKRGVFGKVFLFKYKDRKFTRVEAKE